MSIVVTGATGQLGRLVVEELLGRGVAPAKIVAAGRDVNKINDLSDRGVRIKAIDFDDVPSLQSAFSGAQRVLLVSSGSSELGKRTQQHQNAIDAAAEAGVDLLAYTSMANADRQDIELAAEHQATEKALEASGLDVTVLRNSWYIENYTDQLPVYLEHGVVAGSGGDGRISAATRADYAAAAAVVLTTDGHVGKVYELGGDRAFTLTELAETVSEVAGKEVVYRGMPLSDYAQLLVAAGLPEPVAAILADADRGVAAGRLNVDSGDLNRLIGRSTTTLREAVTGALA
jgi:NAD(P)H dehydrogenase (quinone)